MANDQVQGVIPLDGRGYVHRTTRQYQLGEYREAINVQLSEVGTLIPRPSVQGFVFDEDGSLTNFRTFNEIIGHHGHRPVLMTRPDSNGPEVWYGRSFSITRTSIPATTEFTLAEDNRPTDGTVDSIHQLAVAYFVYNGRSYYIVETGYRPTGSTSDDDNFIRYLSVCSRTTIKSGPPHANTFETNIVDETVENFYDVLTYADPQAYYNVNPSYPKKWLADWTIFKDRLWVAVDNTLYASVATDPGDFEVANGGFFANFTDEIKSISTIGDSLYIIADSSIYVLRYNTDPNTDGEIITVSHTIGGESSVVQGDTVYTLKPNAIYAINGQNINKVLDLQLDLFATQNIRYDWDSATEVDKQGLSFAPKILALDNKLYIVFRYVEYQDTVSYNSFIPFTWQYSNGHRTFQDFGFPGNYKNDRDQCIAIDLDTGFISRYTFGMNGLSIDCYLIPEEDTLNQIRLAFIGDTGISSGHTPLFTLGSRSMYLDAASSSQDFGESALWIAETDILSGNSHSYNVDTGMVASALNAVPPTTEEEFDAFQVWASEIPETNINIQNFSPDTLKYQLKRFRSFLMEMDPGWVRTFPDPNNLVIEGKGTFYDEDPSDSGVGNTFQTTKGIYSLEIDNSIEDVDSRGIRQYFRFTHTGTSLDTYGFMVGGEAGLDPLNAGEGIPVTAGETYRFGLYHRASTSGFFALKVAFYDASRNLLDFNSIDLSSGVADTWEWLAGERVAPANSEFMAFSTTDGYTPIAGDTIDVTQLIVLEGTGDPLTSLDYWADKPLHDLTIIANAESNRSRDIITDEPVVSPGSDFPGWENEFNPSMQMEPFRFGLNQKAKSVDIILKNDPVTYGYWLKNTQYSFWELADMRLLWTYTKKFNSMHKPDNFGGFTG